MSRLSTQLRKDELKPRAIGVKNTTYDKRLNNQSLAGSHLRPTPHIFTILLLIRVLN